MIRAPFLVLVGLLVACGDERSATTASGDTAKKAAPSRPSPLPRVPTSASRSEPPKETGSPAAVLTRYYQLIEGGDYARAFRMREQSRQSLSLERFAASFADYREHRVTIGTPSRTAEAQGWLYVEVPVHIYGTLRSGQPFSTAGTVTMRRRASSADTDWRIYTGD